MKNLIIIFVLILSSSITTIGSELNAHYDSIYTEGNSAYQKLKFDTALQAYLAIVETGLSSADLYYNIGNCYYKLNQPTQAILYYEKALLLKPQGNDIQYNLSLANKLKVDKFEVLPVPFYTEWWQTMIKSLAIDSFGIISIIFMVLAMIGLLVYSRGNSVTLKRISFYLFIVFLLGSGATYLFAKSQYSNSYSNPHAIVLATRTNIFSAPNTTSTVLFVVHEGLKVKVVKTENQWLKIVLPDGSIGWIPEEALVII